MIGKLIWKEKTIHPLTARFVVREVIKDTMRSPCIVNEELRVE